MFRNPLTKNGPKYLRRALLAVEFVHRYGRHFAGGVFWLSFANPEEIPIQVASCGPAEHLDELSLEARLELVLGSWQDELPRLLVFDNCEDEERSRSGGRRAEPAGCW